HYNINRIILFFLQIRIIFVFMSITIFYLDIWDILWNKMIHNFFYRVQKTSRIPPDINNKTINTIYFYFIKCFCNSSDVVSENELIVIIPVFLPSTSSVSASTVSIGISSLVKVTSNGSEAPVR